MKQHKKKRENENVKRKNQTIFKAYIEEYKTVYKKSIYKQSAK